MYNKKIQIAIDGHAGSGKGTLAHNLAKELNITFVDTGAMYRAVAFYLLSKNIDIDNKEKVIENLDKIDIKFMGIDFSRIYINDMEVTDKIRLPEVSIATSKIATIHEVRQMLKELQQNIAKNRSVVMEGRDICNVVLPNADLKLFLTADINQRAKRRYEQLLQKGYKDIELQKVKEDIEQRDYMDIHREEAPLKACEGTKIIDTTNISIDEVCKKVIDYILKEIWKEKNEGGNIKMNYDNSEELNLVEMYEKSLKTIEAGQKIKGTVISISKKNRDIFVDLGYKADGVIPFNEFSYEEGELPEDTYKIGDEIEAIVLKINDGEGNVLLTRKKISLEKNVEELKTAFENKTVVSGTIEKIVNGGVIVIIKGIKVFVPASLIGDSKNDDLNTLLKKHIDLTIINYDKEKRKFVGSQREILKKEKQLAKEKLWESISVGQVVKGVVKSITDFGAFVDIGGQDAMIHISELSWRKIKHPSEILRVGQEIFATIINMDENKGKIALTYKDPQNNPWNKAIENYKVDDIVKGKVVELMPFGAFVELQDGIVGLVHISQISRKRINNPQEVLSVGQQVEAKILEIDFEKKKISLSIKEALILEEVEEKNI